MPVFASMTCLTNLDCSPLQTGPHHSLLQESSSSSATCCYFIPGILCLPAHRTDETMNPVSGIAHNSYFTSAGFVQSITKNYHGDQLASSCAARRQLSRVVAGTPRVVRARRTEVLTRVQISRLPSHVFSADDARFGFLAEPGY